MRISKQEYQRMVRSILWRIEYQKRVEKANMFMTGLKELNREQFWYIQRILKGEL